MATKPLALVSVYDKSGIADFGRALSDCGYDLLSTGGTAEALRDSGLEVIEVADLTDSPEVMGGRVKSLHPRVHGGILSRRDASDERDLGAIGGRLIDVVCVNLYAFEAGLESALDSDSMTELIDIGGPSMVRSAAKNHAHVLVVTDPDDYDRCARMIRQQSNTARSALEADSGAQLAFRKKMAAKAFLRTAAYDAAIARYLSDQQPDEAFPANVQLLAGSKVTDLRYGENPHQEAALYAVAGSSDDSLVMAERLDKGKKALSYNNWVDVDAAIALVEEFNEPTAVVIKHTNPCGLACAAEFEAAYRAARGADELSAFGSVVAFNGMVDAATAHALSESFVECVAAYDFSESALARLRGKGSLRLLRVGRSRSPSLGRFRQLRGGFLWQSQDLSQASELSEARLVAGEALSESQRRDARIAWLASKHVKSNAIVLVKDGVTVGVGAGQMSRVESVRIACRAAGERAQGAVLASDAFFPFPDSVELAARAGVKVAVQPGGSKRDAEVVESAKKLGMAMLMTGRRHFLH